MQRGGGGANLTGSLQVPHLTLSLRTWGRG